MMDKVKKKKVVLVSHKLLSKQHRNGGKATSFMTRGRDKNVQ